MEGQKNVRYAPELSRGQQAFAFFSFACLDRVLKSKPNKNNSGISGILCPCVLESITITKCSNEILEFWDLFLYSDSWNPCAS